jgi:hypothetical protein
MTVNLLVTVSFQSATGVRACTMHRRHGGIRDMLEAIMNECWVRICGHTLAVKAST